MKYRITLEVEESSESMAYQLLALAIKEKHKKAIRPIDKNEWLDIAGMYFDKQKKRIR